MKTISFLFTAALAAASTATAQTQLVRGDIDGIQGTPFFQLDATTVQVVSSTLNLQALHDASRQQDIEYEMQVVQIASNPPVLDVVSAVAIPEMFDMGNLRFGRTETWEVFGTPGSPTAIFIALRSGTGFAPAGPAGAWLLGPGFARLAFGVVGPLGRFQFLFQMPTLPALVGTEISAQALVVDPMTSALTLTNPDSKEVRAD